jgi:type I restriction enzyme R subunit
MRMDYYKKYSEIIADYNREKDRVTIEETFARLVQFVSGLDAEAHRAAAEGLSESEYALFCLLQKENLGQAECERLKRASKDLLESLIKLVAPLERWTEKEQTQAEVKVLILDKLYNALPTPPYTDSDKEAMAQRVYQHVWQQSASGYFAKEAVA